MTSIPLPLRTRARGATVAITSGKGGVGKTSVTVNLATALARLGHRVSILDADFGLGNIDVMLGLTPGDHFGAVLSGEKSLGEVAVEGPEGVRVIPAGSGIRALTNLTPAQWDRLRDVIAIARRDSDFLLVDTAPGICDSVLDLARLTDRVIVVTSYEPPAIVDAYAMVKLLVAAAPHKEIGLVVNGARDGEEGQLVFTQLDAAARRFLGRSVRYHGFIARDASVGESVMEQRPVVTHLPESAASLCFRRLALRVANWPSLGPVAAAARAGEAAARAPMSRDEFEKAEAPRCA